MSRTDGGLRQVFRQRLPQVHWQSIEVPAINKGVPDCNGCYKGVDFWVENKLTHGWTIGLRTEQAAWLTRRARAGGKARIAVRRVVKAGPRKGAAVDELWILDGKYADRSIRVNHLHSSANSVLGVWTGGPARWQWTEVLAALMG